MPELFATDFPSFVPSRSVKGGNLQTVVGSFLPSRAEPNGTIQHRIPTSLGDQLALHENLPQGVDNPRHVILLHGLAGCHASPYVVRACHKLMNAGFRVWRLDARGSGAGVGLARYHHHAGRIEDLQAAIDFISTGNDDAPVTIVGFSLGGNLVLNWLASRHSAENRRVDSTISVAPPVNLFECTRYLRSGLGRGYDLYFARMMLRRVAERRRAMPRMIDFRFSRTPETLAQFDSQFTAPAGGFDGLEDYYAQCSSLEKLHRIKIPTLLIIDEADPVIPVSMFDPQRFSNAIQVLRTNGGGHLGYIGKRAVDPDRYWLDWRIVQAIRFIDNPEIRS